MVPAPDLSPIQRPSDLLGRRVKLRIDPLEITSPPDLPSGTVVKIFDREPAPYDYVFLLTRLTEEVTIQLPSRGRMVSLRYVLVQLERDWTKVLRHIKTELPDWRVKYLLYGTSDKTAETAERIEWRRFFSIAPGLICLEAGNAVPE